MASKAGNGSALIAAVQTGQEGEVQRQLIFGADVNQKDSQGITPLMAAIDSNNESMVTMLLIHGANPNAVDNEGRSVLTRAVFHASKPGNHNFAMLLAIWGAK